MVKIVKYHLVFVKPLSELHLSSHTVHVTNANKAVTLVSVFRSFLQNGGKQTLSKYVCSKSFTSAVMS